MVRRPGLAPPAAPAPITPAKPVEEEFDAEATMVRRPGLMPPAKPVEEEFDADATMVRRPGSVPPPPPAPPQVTEAFDPDATMVRRPGSVPPPPLPAARPAAPAPVRPAQTGGDPLGGHVAVPTRAVDLFSGDGHDAPGRGRLVVGARDPKDDVAPRAFAAEPRKLDAAVGVLQ